MVSESKMRVILFQGKRTKTGEWVYGYYYRDDESGKTYIITWEPNTGTTWAGSLEIENFVEVIPETVGQYTGRTDKNRKRIFEGDIVKCIRTMCDGAKMVGYIVFDDCCFSVKERTTPNQPAMDLCDDFEVIGNIHDNPELLEAPHV